MSEIAERSLPRGIGYTSAPSHTTSPASRAPEPGPRPASERLRDRVVERAVEREPRGGTRATLDYRQPSTIERALMLRAAFDRSGADENQRLLLRELMAHYRDWCVRHGLGDPFDDDVT